MRKLIVATWLITLMSLAFTGAASSDLKVGISAPLTGPAAAWGIDLVNVATFANEKLAQGRYSLVIEDDKCVPIDAVTIAQKLIYVDRVAASLIVCGATALAAAPLYERAHLVLMAPITTPRRISDAGDYIFRPGISDAASIRLLAKTLARSHKVVGVVTEQNEATVSILEEFSARSKAAGFKIVNQDFKSNETDFRAQLLKLKSSNIDAIFINSNTEGPFSALLRQLKELRLELPVFGTYIPGTTEFLKLAGDNAEGIIFVDFPFAEQILTEEGKRLYEEYTKRFGPMKSWDYSFPAVFETFRALHAALDSGQAPQKYLYETKFNGIFGEYSFDEKGDLVGLLPSVKVIRKGKAVLYDAEQ